MYGSKCEFEQRPYIRLRQSYAKGIPGFSRKLQARERVLVWYAVTEGQRSGVWSSKNRELELEHRSEGEPTTGVFVCKPNLSPVANRPRESAEADKIIRRILNSAIDPDLRDENEPAPTHEVVKRAIHLITGADRLLDGTPPGQVSTFYGELNIAWRAGDKIVRLACFPDRPSVIQVGLLSLPLGSYRSEENPTAMLLAARLYALGL